MFEDIFRIQDVILGGGGRWGKYFTIKSKDKEKIVYTQNYL